MAKVLADCSHYGQRSKTKGNKLLWLPEGQYLGHANTSKNVFQALLVEKLIPWLFLQYSILYNYSL